MAGFLLRRLLSGLLGFFLLASGLRRAAETPPVSLRE
jgi:hypothetical protein